MRRLTTGLALGAAAATFAAGAPAAAALPGATPAGPPSDRQALKLGADDTLVQRSVLTDPDGTTHTRYDRTWKGLRVVGGDLVVEKAKGGRIEDVQLQQRQERRRGHHHAGRRRTTAVSTGQQRSKASRETSAASSWSGPRPGRRAWPTTC